ncbi:MAG: cupredoxin domain-containing protein [Curvibacter sp.]|nr:cupredoxin domain-containing protein [Curvibacter sp.]
MNGTPLQRRQWLGGAALVLGLGSSAWALGAARPRVIRVVARKFEFVPREIRVRRGETVELQLSAPEVPMGIHVIGLELRADIVPGQVTRLRLTPEQEGRFDFLCDVFCGSGHEDMSGVLVVEGP